MIRSLMYRRLFPNRDIEVIDAGRYTKVILDALKVLDNPKEKRPVGKHGTYEYEVMRVAAYIRRGMKRLPLNKNIQV